MCSCAGWVSGTRAGTGVGTGLLVCCCKHPASESQSHFRRQFLEKHKKCKKQMNARQRPVHDTIRCILLSVRCKHTASLHTHTHTVIQTHWHAEQAGWQDKGEARVQKAKRVVKCASFLTIDGHISALHIHTHTQKAVCRVHCVCVCESLSKPSNTQ